MTIADFKGAADLWRLIVTPGDIAEDVIVWSESDASVQVPRADIYALPNPDTPHGWVAVGQFLYDLSRRIKAGGA